MVQNQHLAERYNADTLQLLVKDPTTLYAYWDVSDRKRWLVAQHYCADWSVMPKIVRLYAMPGNRSDGTGHRRTYADTNVGDSSSWYFTELLPNCTYIADFGILNVQRQFIPLLRSNIVMTPRNTEADFEETDSPDVLSPHGRSIWFQELDGAMFEQFSAYTLYEPHSEAI